MKRLGSLLTSTAGKLTKDRILALPSTPACSPAYGFPPNRFFNREYFIVQYRSDPASVAKTVPWPLRPTPEAIVMWEWIKMPDSTGFGSYTESGTVIPCIAPDGREVNFTAQMFLDDEPPIAGGREIWGFPKKYANPTFGVSRDTLFGTLEYEGLPVAMGTMAYKAKPIPQEAAVKGLSKPQVNLKVIPAADGRSMRIAQLVEYQMAEIEFIEAWEGPARVQFYAHALAPASSLPVLSYIGGKHFKAHITLPYGRVMHDYLADTTDSPENGRLTRAQILKSPMPAISPTYSLERITGAMEEVSHFICISTADSGQVAAFVPTRFSPLTTSSGDAVVSLRWQDGSGTGVGEYRTLRMYALCRDNVTKEIVQFCLMGFADSSAAITFNREVLGRPTKFGQPKLTVHKDVLVGSLEYSTLPVCTATMAYKYQSMDYAEAAELLATPEVNLKYTLGCDGKPALAELVRTGFRNLAVKQAWSGPGQVSVTAHCNAPISDFGLKEVIGSFHVVASGSVLEGSILENFLA